MVKNNQFVDVMEKNIQALAKQEDPVFVLIILEVVLVDRNHLKHVKNHQNVLQMNFAQDH